MPDDDSPTGWFPESNLNHLSVADWAVAADGSVSLIAAGQVLYLGAVGSSTAVMVNSATTFTLVCGPAVMVVGAGEESAGSGFVLQGGAEGGISLAAGPTDEGPMVNLSPENLTLRVGPAASGAAIYMEAELISISVGPEGEGASIEITPESVTIKVAEVTFTLDAEGITEDVAEVTREMTAEGHNLTAAETEVNVGVQGETAEGPTEEKEVEAGTVENETLGSDTTDAAKNVDAGVMATE